MKVLNKKVAIIIIIFAVLLLVINMLANWFIYLTNTQAMQQCKSSVRAHAGMHLSLADISIRIQCPTLDENIDAKKKEIIMRNVAEKMCQCFDTYGGPERLELFDDPMSKTNYCASCYHLTFDENMEITWEEQLNYMNNNKYKNSGKTYLQFLNMPFESFSFEPINGKVPGFTTAMDQLVLFTYKKTTNHWLITLGTAIGGLLLIVGGAAIAFFTWPTGGGIVAGLKVAAIGVAVVGIAVGGTIAVADNTRMVPGEDREWNPGVIVMPADPVALASLNCNELPVMGTKGKG